MNNHHDIVYVEAPKNFEFVVSQIKDYSKNPMIYIPPEATVVKLKDVFVFTKEELDKRDNKWISVDEGLPEDHSLAMVWVEEVNQAVKHYYDGRRWQNKENDTILLPKYFEVKFWQPLFESPVKKIKGI